MKECDAPESNSTTTEVSLTRNIPMTISRASWASSTVTWLILPWAVLLGSNRNRVGSMGRGRGRCSSSSLTSTGVWIGASVGIMSLLSTIIAPMISSQWVLGSLGPLNTLIPSNRGLEIVGTLNHLMLRGRKSLSSCLRPRFRLWPNRTEHRSS
jgi:hypothetical protein